MLEALYNFISEFLNLMYLFILMFQEIHSNLSDLCYYNQKKSVKKCSCKLIYVLNNSIWNAQYRRARVKGAVAIIY